MIGKCPKYSQVQSQISGNLRNYSHHTIEYDKHILGVWTLKSFIHDKYINTL